MQPTLCCTSGLASVLHWYIRYIVVVLKLSNLTLLTLVSSTAIRPAILRKEGLLLGDLSLTAPLFGFVLKSLLFWETTIYERLLFLENAMQT